MPAPQRLALRERLCNSDAGADIVARIEKLVLQAAAAPG
jgi:hypothetical protein